VFKRLTTVADAEIFLSKVVGRLNKLKLSALLFPVSCQKGRYFPPN